MSASLEPEFNNQFSVASFVDDGELNWEVREISTPVLPERRGLFSRPEFANGWLLFMCGIERRRLAPFPPGWRLATKEQLQRWCAEATPVTTKSP
ncbi:MAG: hypothetical protein ABIY52_16290 [Gemmatimonadaceae bacterium]